MLVVVVTTVFLLLLLWRLCCPKTSAFCLDLIPHYARPGTNDPPPPPRPAKPDSNFQLPPYDAPQQPPPRPAKPSFEDASILFKHDPSPLPPPRNERRNYVPTHNHGIPGFRGNQHIQGKFFLNLIIIFRCLANAMCNRRLSDCF